MSTNLVTEVGADSAVAVPSASSVGLWINPPLTWIDVFPVVIVWLILLGAALFVGLAFLRQILVIMNRRKEVDARVSILLRLAASSGVAGWIALGVGIAVTGYSFHNMIHSPVMFGSGVVDAGYVVLCTYQSCTYGFVGVLIWVVSMLQGALARLWEVRHLSDRAGRAQ